MEHTENQPPGARVSGSITTHDGASSETPDVPMRIEWKSNVLAELYICEGNLPESLLDRGFRGTREVSWIKPEVRYVLRLYDQSVPRQIVSEKKVDRRVHGKMAVEADPGQFAVKGAVNLRWEITTPTIGEILLCENGSNEKLVCRGPSGTFQVNGLRPGVRYLFRLYAVTAQRPLLNEVKFEHEINGQITASPNPIPADAGSNTLLRWEITPPVAGEIWLSENGAAERLVCSGRSGTFAVAGLRLGNDYVFRLYNHLGPRQLLSSITVRLEEIPWTSLLAKWESQVADNQYSSDFVQFLGSVLKRSLHHPRFAEFFRLWEQNGVHVTPVHFYQPIPNTQALPDHLWQGPSSMPGVEMNKTVQQHLLCQVFPSFKDEYGRIPIDRADTELHFYLHNGRFESLDPMIAYCMVRHFRPKRIIEVGSGYSTLLLAQAAHKNGDTSLESIEPYPEKFLTEGVPGLTSLFVQKVEEVDLSFFSRLEEGDFLFIDTSHVVRTGGDVNHLFLNVVPQLKPGVIIHVHDIFFPYEYSQEWVVNLRRFWTEQYLLQAFLVYNSEFEVLVSSGYLKWRFPNTLKQVFPNCSPWQGGSFWMQRKKSSDPTDYDDG